ncbi:MAG: PAS domain S-box protein [Deltaproteobacteria bacterium]|nr:MAG: PAS domain S-box protein [Deltaproteobacteria bacterium]
MDGIMTLTLKDNLSALREKAEQTVRQIPAVSEAASVQPVHELIHNLQVHQVELEMQNNELRQTEEDLELSRDMYFQLFHQAPVGYVTVDENGMIIQSNQTIANMLKSNISLLDRRPFINFVHKEDRDIFTSCLQMILKQPNRKNFEIRMCGSSNEIFHVALSGRIAMVPSMRGDRQRELLLILTDITDRKKVEEELKENRKRLSDIIEDIPAMICRFDPTGSISYVNNEYCAFYGRTENELLERNVFDLIPEERKQFVREQFSSLTPDCPVKTYEDQVLSGSGETKWLRWTNRAIFTKKSEVSVYQKIGYDITESIRIEHETREKEKLKGIIELAGAVCHEFSQPIHIISGFLDLIQMSPDAHHLYQKLNKIKEQIERMTGLTHRLNNITRYDTKAYGLNETIVDLQKSSERRLHERFMPGKSTIINCIQNDTMSGQLIDISRGGLSFWSKNKTRGKKIEINIHSAGTKFSIQKIPCIIIAEMDSSKSPYMNTGEMKRHRLKYGSLSSDQQDQIDHFIKKYTIQ